jgi:hypothetical protein
VEYLQFFVLNMRVCDEYRQDTAGYQQDSFGIGNHYDPLDKSRAYFDIVSAGLCWISAGFFWISAELV